MFKFLNVLNETYQGVRSQLIMMKAFPSLDQAYNMVLREETKRSMVIQTQSFPKAAVMVVEKSKVDITCFQCGKSSHVKAQCYRLIGFPTDFKFTKSRSGAPSRNNSNHLSRSFVQQVSSSTNETTSQLNFSKEQSKNSYLFSMIKVHTILFLLLKIHK